MSKNFFYNNNKKSKYHYHSCAEKTYIRHHIYYRHVPSSISPTALVDQQDGSAQKQNAMKTKRFVN